MSVNQRPSLLDAKYGLMHRMWSHRLFRRMLQRQQIDLSAAAWSETEAIVYRALDNCAHCKQKATCRAWLAGAAPPAGYMRFCPNSEAIEALRIALS